MTRPEAVLFDLDGVLLDSMPWHVRSWQEVFRELGAEVESRFIYLHEGALERSGLAKMLTETGCPCTDDDIERLLTRQIEVFNQNYANRVKPFKDALKVLVALKEKGLRLALVTSSSAAVVRRSVPGELLDQFEAIVTSSDIQNFKPHPEPYLKGLAGLGLEAGRAVAVENAPAGLASAKGAGLYCYGLTTTLEPADLHQADLVLNSLTELVNELI